jgi:leucyl-tRNA synthetase
VKRSTVLAFLQLLAPFAPHFAEELWERMGEKPSVLTAPWPKFDPAKLVSTEQKVVIQVNGKHRGELLVPVGTTQDDIVAQAKANEKVTPHLAGKEVKRIIYVPGKILNIVVQ